MENDEKQSCVQPAKGPVVINDNKLSKVQVEQKEEELKMLARVGKPAPDFEANAYFDGAFKNIKLSDYKGQWVTLCFYPGDFTFV
jgi:hypothetical protein